MQRQGGFTVRRGVVLCALGLWSVCLIGSGQPAQPANAGAQQPPIEMGGCGYYRYAVGPEKTGNYAQPYLRSLDGQQTYADPAYYTAQEALRRWHNRRPARVQYSDRPVRVKRQTLEK